MELVLEKPELIAESHDMPPSKGYKMDMAFVQSYLRGEIYSDPTRAALQEYLSNARDTHVEIGRPDLIPQIIFSLPYDTDDTVTIRDFGLGIDPWRHDNFFAAYGCSTKRDTPDQMGKYGLGCKTAFADKSRDSFIVETVWRNGHDEQGNPMHGLFRRQYRHFVNEDGLNSYEVTFDEQLPQDSDELTGTKIILPVSRWELGSFYKTAMIVTMFWANKPEFINIREDWKISYALNYGIASEVVEEQELDLGIDGEPPRKPITWGTMKGTTSNFLVVDDIPYEIDLDVEMKGVFVRCSNSDVKVTATREKLDLDRKGKTLPFVIQRFKEVKIRLQYKVDLTAIKLYGFKDWDEFNSRRDHTHTRYLSWYDEDASHLSTGADKSTVNGFVVERHRFLELTAEGTDAAESGEERPTTDCFGNALVEDDFHGIQVKFSISGYETISSSQFVGSDFVLMNTGYQSEVRKKETLSVGKIESAFLANPNAKYLIISSEWKGVQKLSDFKPVKYPNKVGARGKRVQGYTFYFRRCNNENSRIQSVKVMPDDDRNIMVCLAKDYYKLVRVFNSSGKTLGNTLYFTRRMAIPDGFLNPYEILQIRMERLRSRIGDLPKNAFYIPRHLSREWRAASLIPFFSKHLVSAEKANLVEQYNKIAKLLEEKLLPEVGVMYDTPRKWEYNELMKRNKKAGLTKRLRLVKPARKK